METLRKNHKKMREIKHTVTEMNGIFSRLGVNKERISELQEMSIETSKIEIQREKTMRRETRIPKNCGSTKKM